MCHAVCRRAKVILQHQRSNLGQLAGRCDRVGHSTLKRQCRLNDGIFGPGACRRHCHVVVAGWQRDVLGGPTERQIQDRYFSINPDIDRRCVWRRVDNAHLRHV